MATTTVAQLAAELNRPAAALLEQLQSAGVRKLSTDDALTESDKERLLDHLRSAHGSTAGAQRTKITLTRKSTSEIKQADSSGKARTIQVEVRKKRTFIKRDDAPAGAEATSAPQVDEVDLQRREDEAKAQAEVLRLEEEALAEKRRLREEQEQREREAAEAQARQAAQEAAAAAEAAEQASAAAAAAAAAAPKAKPGAKGGKAKPEVAAPVAEAPVVAAPVVAPAPVAEPAKPQLRVIKAADVVDEDKQRAADLAKRRKAAEDEASAIRAMMNKPKGVQVAKKPEEPKP
ncbi:MAG: translation initiation factor IF-2 associated domain-containing protein, partial [Burkholderiaceae bacterium]